MTALIKSRRQSNWSEKSPSNSKNNYLVISFCRTSLSSTSKLWLIYACPNIEWNTVVHILPLTQIGAKLWIYFHKHLQNKKSNANSFLQNLLQSASSTGYNFKFLWDDTMSNRRAMQNSSPWPDRSPNSLQTAWTAVCTVLPFCCCFSSALKSRERANPSFPNGQKGLQVVIYDNYLFSHQASNTALPQTLNAESFWNTSSTCCPEGFLKMRMRDHLMNIFHIHGQSKLDQRTF